MLRSDRTKPEDMGTIPQSPASRASRAARLAVEHSAEALDRTTAAGGARLKPSTHAWLADRHARTAAAAASEVMAAGDSVTEMLSASMAAQEARAAAAMATAAARVSRIRALLDALEAV